MAWQFSDETRDLLDRAQRAIDHSFRLRQARSFQLARAVRLRFDLEDHLIPAVLEKKRNAGTGAASNS